jgi:UDP-N-acetylglucosamine 2-epimerase (non-hydrolysing)
VAKRPLRVLSVFGTRPEAVKMAPVVQRLAETPGVESLVCVTGQHREMLDPVLSLFRIRPKFDLKVMEPGQAPAQVAAAILTRLDPVLRKVQPDWVLVQGDTTTVLAAALLAYFRQISVGHVEAGLRTGDKWQPFPEEINRRVAGIVADLHFAPTEWARQNLLREGVAEDQILVTGNPVIDALEQIRRMPYDMTRGPLADVRWDKRVLLVTLHRREHFGPTLEGILRALRTLAERRSQEIELVYPVHLNPHVHGPAHAALGGLANVHLIEPLDYLPMVHLMARCYLALTDSGGIQEEAPALGTPVLVLREKTERPEAIEAGTARLAGVEPEKILSAAEELLDGPQLRAAMANAVSPFGDGHAAERIAAALVERSLAVAE